MISYVPTSLAWPSPSPKKTTTQDQKTLTYKVKHFFPPYQKKWSGKKRKQILEDQQPLSGKDRLMALLLAEKAATTVALKASSSFRPTTAYDLETSSTETETSQRNGLFQVCWGKFSFFKKTCFIWQEFWFLQSLRQSFRRKKNSILQQHQHPGDISHDSGLGEDSDSPISPRTSPLTPILRTPLQSSSSNYKPLKQVMIREPSLKHLPSAIRNSYPGAMPACTGKPQLVKLQNRHYRYSYHADNMVGDVSGQWNSLYFRAAQEVKLRQEGCDKVKQTKEPNTRPLWILILQSFTGLRPHIFHQPTEDRRQIVSHGNRRNRPNHSPSLQDSILWLVIIINDSSFVHYFALCPKISHPACGSLSRFGNDRSIQVVHMLQRTIEAGWGRQICAH